MEKVIINDQCECGCLKTSHDPSPISGAEGHGECCEDGCPCRRFTWDHFVTAPLFQLLQWKAAIKLEKVGIKVARRSVTAAVKRYCGITGGRDKVRNHVIDLIDNGVRFCDE